jgi:hypothetical protein
MRGYDLAAWEPFFSAIIAAAWVFLVEIVR